MVNLRALRPPWVTASGNQELARPRYNDRIAEAFLSFFPHYSETTINNMIMNVMAHWHVPVDTDMSFRALTYWADMVEADRKKQAEELAKQARASKKR